jgi:6,7-dimethyl-8-ribityllumazine synthase
MNQPSPPISRPVVEPSATLPPWRIAIVAASWHRDIVDRARAAMLATFARARSPSVEVEGHDVPGAFEIPLMAQALARSGRFDAVIACALVVDGGIYRHEFVAAAVIDGLMRVQLDTGVPVFSAVLTPQAFHEHDEHRRFFHAHFVTKGEEVAGAALHTLALHRAWRTDLATSASVRGTAAALPAAA